MNTAIDSTTIIATTSTTAAIPLDKLTAWAGNVRRTGADTGLAELSASIAAHGLLQSLVVRKDRKGKYAVIAGRRRFLALKSLAEAGTIKADTVIPCHLIDATANATEIGLVENAVRAQMHPADEFEAFLALIEGGMRAADIAARFGVTETVVQQRLKLARVSPVIIEAYRRNEIALAHVMAFAVSDDHAAQEHVWEELSEWQLEDPDNIRDALTESEVTAKDRRVKFVTLKAYEKAGGTVRRDLFAQGDDGVFIQDIVLLESLVANKLEKTAAAVRKEGWKWVEVRAAFDYSEWSKCGRHYPEPAPLPPAEEAELAALEAEQKTLSESVQDWDEIDPGIEARLSEIEERLDELNERESVFSPEDIAIAGCVVSIGHDAKPEIHHGYVLPEDVPKKSAKALTQTDEDGNVITVAAHEKSGLPAALIDSLTAQKSAALAACLTESPGIALAAVVHAMALDVFYRGAFHDSSVRLSATCASLHRVEDSAAFGVLERAREIWGDKLPGSPDALWTWCLEQHRDTLLDLMAFCAARTVNAVQLKGDKPDCKRLQHAERLAAALKLDMTKWFTPTKENYFGRITKTGILAALAEVKGSTAPAWEKAKKSDLAAIAEREIAASGWLPAVLRSSISIKATTYSDEILFP